MSVYFVAGLFSILLSVWIYAGQSVINADAICYLQSAQTLGAAGVHAATHLCEQAKWPFYSALIFGLVSVAKISYVKAAFVWNGFFSLISVVTFIAITRLLTNTSRVWWLAAMTILLMHEFNSVRQYIIRDHGFWAFYLISVFFLLQYFRSRSWVYALLWGASLIIASLFRVEGIIFLLFLPWVTWFCFAETVFKRAVLFLQLNIVTIVLGVALCIWVLLHPQLQLSRLSEIQFQFWHGVNAAVTGFHTSAVALGKYVLSPYAAHDAGIILFLMLIIWHVQSVVTNVSSIYAVLIVYAWWKKLLNLDKPAQLVLYSYIIINIIITAIFLVEHMFFSKRYLIALSLILLFWVPFALENLIQQWSARKWPLILAMVFIIVSSLGGIFDFGHSKKYIYNAGEWLAEHAPPQAKIYSNNYQVMYYSNHFGNQIFIRAEKFSDINTIAHGEWKKYDYLALELRKNELGRYKNILNEINLTPIQVFSNSHGDQVRIYRRY